MRHALCIALLALLPAPSEASDLPLSGRVVGADGAPVAAHVVFGCQAEVPFTPYETLAAVQADADGRFELRIPADWVERGGVYRELDAFAWLEGHGIVPKHWAVAEVPAGSELELRLPAPIESRLRFVDAEGAPVAGARVWPDQLRTPFTTMFRMPEEWWLAHAFRTDADGWARLPVAREDLESVGFEASGFGLQRFTRDWRSEGPWPEELVVAAPLERALRIDAELPAECTIELTSYEPISLEGGARYTRSSEWRGELGAARSLTVLATSGSVNANVSSADASVLALEGVMDEDGGLVLRPGPAVPVRLRVVDGTDGRPVEGVSLIVRTLHTGIVTSDADGLVAFECGAGFVSVLDVRPPPGYERLWFPDGLDGRGSDPTHEIDLGELRLTRTWTAEGVVRGADGEPRSGVFVVGSQKVATGGGTRDVQLSAVTDEAGRYSLPGALEQVPLEVLARDGDLSAKAEQAPGEALELALVASLRARGSLLTADGEPIGGAELEFWLASPPNTRGGEKRMELGGGQALRTAEDGSFESGGGLAAEERYCVAWSGAQCERGGSEWFTGAELAAGVELRARRLGFARGVLHRADGSPLAGASLRSRASGLACTTDEQGRFELPGIGASGDVLIAVDPFGALHALRVEAELEEIDWTLFPAGPEHPLTLAPVPDRGRELELAHELLDARFEEARAAQDDSRMLRAVQRLAWVDPARVLELAESGLFETDWMRDYTLAYVADALCVEHPEEAIAVTGRIARGMTRSLAVLEAAEHLDPEAEREQLALVRAEARAVDPPEHRVIVLRHLADRLLDLGEREAALDVIAEGRELAASLPGEQWPGYARGRFGELLARVDREAGRALIEGVAEDRDRHLLNEAQELAASDPAAAEELLAQVRAIGGSFSLERYAARIAHRMAPVDLERARRIAAKYDRSGFADGMIALALCERDPAEARASLETAFRRAEELPTGRLGWSENPMMSAAALLPLAERVDPDGLRAWVTRALALSRRPDVNAFESSHSLRCRDDAALAFYIARWDRELARTLLEPAVDAARHVPDLDRSDYDPIWAAAAVVDLEWAGELARELGSRAADVVGLVLAIPPEQRTRFVQDKYFDLWVVGKEDI